MDEAGYGYAEESQPVFSQRGGSSDEGHFMVSSSDKGQTFLLYLGAGLTVIYAVVAIIFLCLWGDAQNYILAFGIFFVALLLIGLWRWSTYPDVERKFLFFVLYTLFVLLVLCTAAVLITWLPASWKVCKETCQKQGWGPIPTTTTTTTTLSGTTMTMTTTTTTAPTGVCADCGNTTTNCFWYSTGPVPQGYQCCYPQCQPTTPLLNLLTGQCQAAGGANATKFVDTKLAAIARAEPPARSKEDLGQAVALAPSDAQHIPALVEALRAYADALERDLLRQQNNNIRLND